MLIELSLALFLNHEAKIDIRVWETALCEEASVVDGLVVQLFHLECDEFFRIFLRRLRHS